MSFRVWPTAIAVLLAACSTAAQPTRQSGSDVVATVGDAAITLAEVDEHALRESARNFGGLTLGQALDEARRATLDGMIGRLLVQQEANALGIEPAVLTNREITAKVTAPTDADVAAWYRENPSRVQGASLEQLSAPIRNLLLEERTRSARQLYLDTLRERIPVTMTLEPPRIAIDDAGRPARGPAEAPVEIIEFSDFECPYCLRARPILVQVLKTYGHRVRHVYRHYPLPNHPNARPAAEASACAAEQEQFWPYHDRLFANQARLGGADLKQHAAELGLDVARFNACFDGRRYRDDVDADIQAATGVGVSGTPAFFINGRPLNGALPFEEFKRVIDEELRRGER